MQENIITDESNENNGYQILITGISWNPKSTKAFATKKDAEEELPSQFILDLPENVYNQANKSNNIFNDVIESFIYNFLTRKFNHEVYHCQIWLPLEEKNEKVA